jgi:hypothetical protein
MIRREWEGGFLVFAQPEHARISGVLAEHWGAGGFQRPEPWAETLLATQEHDNGWQEWEENPALNAEGLPAHFTETPLEVNFDIFRRGVSRLYGEGHPYAAALVSRHAANVYNAVRRVRPVTPEEEARIDAYIAEQDEKQSELSRELVDRPGYERAATSEGIHRNGRFVTTLDAFSLVRCNGWRHMNHLAEVPVGVDDFTDISLQLENEKSLRVSPWPFNRDSVEVSAHGRLLPSSPFPTVETFHAALNEALSKEIALRLTPG